MITLEQTLRAYEGYAPTYDIVFGPIFRSSRKLAVSLANDRPNQSVLEIGIGTGLSLPFYRKDAQLTGVDVSEDMLAKARQRALLGPANCRLELMNGERMEFEDGSFDVVVALYLVTTVQDLARFGAEVRRVCKPGGTDHSSEPYLPRPSPADPDRAAAW